MTANCYNVAQLFARVVRRHGERPAIHFDGAESLSYARLNALSNQLARRLIACGVRRGDRVGICLEKGLPPYVVMLAALKVGAVYFAVDPDSPPQRNESILRQCAPKLLFTDGDRGLDSSAESTVVVDDWWRDFPARCEDDRDLDASALDGSTPAYVMFTSGSTGTPKGAVISHGNLVHFARWAREQYDFTPADRHTHLNPLYFDNSVFDVYSTLLTGGCLVPFRKPDLADPARLVQRIADMQCTIYFSVPSLLMYLQVVKEIRREPLRTLRLILFGGEGYPKVKLRQLYEEVGRQTTLVNVYGPTECTCICSSYVVTDSDFEDLDGLPPLGRLIGNFRGYLLDGGREAVPGEAAELCLGGPCVGLGYFHQPQQTQSSFVQNPLNESYLERIYRTGDLVRRDPNDGKLYFAGRQDLQIKHQGYRIELEEIQHALVSIEGVDDAAALHFAGDGHSNIVGVVAGRGALDSRTVKAQLALRIPAYMIPQRIHVLDGLPKNANGKTDRRELHQRFAKAA